MRMLMQLQHGHGMSWSEKQVALASVTGGLMPGLCAGSRHQAPSDESYLDTEAGKAVLSDSHEFYAEGWWGRGDKGPYLPPPLLGTGLSLCSLPACKASLSCCLLSIGIQGLFGHHLTMVCLQHGLVAVMSAFFQFLAA